MFVQCSSMFFNLYHSLDEFSRWQIDNIFLIFPRKQDLTFHANCFQWRQFAWNAKPISWKKYFIMSSAEKFIPCAKSQYIWHIFGKSTPVYIFSTFLQNYDRSMSQGTAFPTQIYVCPLKTQISLCMHSGWSGFSLSAWRYIGFFATDRMPADWSDCADAQADLSPHWVHKQSCRNCCALERNVLKF